MKAAFVHMYVVENVILCMNFQECIEKSFNGKITSRKCPHVEFPNHPRMFFRKPCDTLLLKEVRFGSKKFATPIGNFVTKVLPNLLLNFSLGQGLLRDVNIGEKGKVR
jgi:hypothetical protein